MEAVNKKNNFIYLTLSLVVLLMSGALSDVVPDGLLANLLLQGISISTLVVAYISLDFGPIFRRVVAAMVVLLLIFYGLSATNMWSMANVATFLVLLAFFVLCAFAAARQVLFSGTISTNHIVGSIAIYLLLGLIWSVMYMITLEFYPNAINNLVYEGWGESYDRVVYFSYVTLATLGYGDMYPTEPITRVLAFLEAITGTFYMAVVVASLIGASSTGLRNRNNKH
jgi:voltage-gated potassium channel